MAEMITLTIGGVTYEIVDQALRNYVANLETVGEAEVKKIVEDSLNTAGVESFATKDEVGAKADDVLFPDDYRVKTAVGGFAVGDSLQNLTLREIIKKILKAKSATENIDTIMANKIPMLSGSSAGLNRTTYSFMTMTPAQAVAAPSSSGFYQISEDGVVSESGYQIMTESTGRKPYAMALIEGATIVKVYMWDDLTRSWTDYSPVFTPTGTITVDGVTYTTYESSDSSSGEVLRFVIE